MAKRIASIVLVLVLLVSLFPNIPITVKAAGTLSETQFANKIAALKKEYPDGKYWSNKNGTVQSGTYKGTSLAGDAKCSDSYYWSSNCGTLVLSGTTTAWQCHGFALLLGHKIFGSNANNWSKYTSKSRQIYAGDVLRIDTDGDGINDDYDHTIFVYRVTSTHIYYVDCNKTKPCQINWDGEMTLTALRSKLLYVRHLTDNTLTGNGTDTPVLSVKYNANGGTIANTDITGYTYKVTESAGVNMRKGAGTSYDVVKTLTKGTTFSVNIGDTKTANGYTWGKTTVGGSTGWVVISDYVSKTATLRGSTYYLNSSLVYKSSSSAVLVHNMTYGETSANGLYNESTFGLTKDGYTFVGWSLTTDGGTIIDQNQALKPEEIVPDLKNGSKTITLYAIWAENTPANITVSFNANGGIGTMDCESSTKGESFTVPEPVFTKDGHSFIGWTVQREDGLWYTDTNTWGAEDAIIAQGNAKKAFSIGDTITLNSPFVTISGDHSYTLYAVWKNDSIQSIQVTSVGKEEIYYIGDTLNTGSISLLVSYVDGSFEIVNEGFNCAPTTLSNEGTETITVTYGSLSTTFNVQVTKAKTSKANGTGKADSKGYLLPSTSAGTIAGQGVWKSDSVHVLCKDGNFYLTFIPWGATSVTASNRVLLYLPTSAVTVSGTIPLAADYYSLNPTGENNATVNSKVYAYHRTDGGANPVKYGSTAYTTMGPLAAGDRVKVLFEMDGYYCVQTASYTGFVTKSAITLDKILCGIYVDSPTTDFCLTAEKGKEIDTSSLIVAGTYSDGTNQTVSGYEIDLPDTTSTGLKYATISYGGFTTFVPVQITSPVITGISVNTNPTKVKYTPDEQLDLTGLKINVEYEDGNVETVSQGFTAKTEDFSDTGYTAVAIEYMGFETHIAVFVYDPIQVKTQSVDGYIGQTVSVPVTFNCTSDDVEVYSFLASFSYDSSKMEYRGFTSEGVLDATRLIVNPDSNNKIVVAYASDAHIPADSTMLEFQFNIIDEGMETTHYSVSIDECTMYDYASEPFVLNTESGSVNNLGLVTVNYAVGEGTNAPEQLQAKYGVQITISEQTPSREGFEFAGWALSTDATTADYNAGDTIDCLSNITLYAVWNIHSHNWDSGVITTPATHTATGVMTYTCTSCSATKTEDIPKVTGHSFGSWSKLDNEKHQRSCACGEVETAAHNWNAGTITLQPTHTTFGERTYECQDCSATKTEQVAKTTDHAYGKWTKVDNETHERTCACGDKETANHSWNNGVVTTPATHTATGVMTYTCTSCSATKTEDIPKVTGHSFGSWSKLDNEKHQRSCACGEVETAAHNWNVGTITLQPTHTTFGERTHECQDCSATKTERVAKVTDHAYGSWTKVDSQTHQRTCACGDVETEAHELDQGKVIKQPSATEPGELVRSCLKCDYEESSEIEPIGTAPQIIVGSKQASKGGTVRIAVSLANNSGITSMRLSVDYDSSVMTLIDVTDSGKLGTALHSNQYTDPYVLCWANDTVTDNFVVDGEVVILTFKIKESAALGTYNVSVSYDYDRHDIHNVQAEKVKFYTTDGNVNIVDELIGDANGDGTVDTLDRLTLSRYLANWTGYTIDQINNAGADINGDGFVDTLDRLILSRHLANWAGYEDISNAS